MKIGMTKFEILLVAVGLGMLAVLLKHLDFNLVKASLSMVGTGFFLIFLQEIVAYVLNTLGWKYASLPELEREITFPRLLKLRIAGDGLNYLTPSATLAGEWARASMLGDHQPLSTRLSSVALAKITQVIAMGITSLAALIWAFFGKVSFSNLGTQLKFGVWLLAGLFVIVILIELRASRSSGTNPAQGTSNAPAPDPPLSKWAHIKTLDKKMMSFIKTHPSRFFLSVLCFLGGYLWGAFEAYWIAYFLNIPVDIPTAILIEMLSVFMDGVFFAVPGKAGTQEATKTAIFASLGMSPSLGFAFAVVRHIREIVWAVAGLVLFYHDRIITRKITRDNPTP